MSEALQIKTLTTVVAGKFKDTFAVVDVEGNLIGSKAHTARESAEAELGSLKFYADGLAFARATAPAGASEKGLVGKANVIAAYLLWKEQGEPVREAEAAEEVAEATEDAPVEEAAVEEEF